MSTRNIPYYDVVIAGARCAGAATALLLARQGARVLVLDKSRATDLTFPQPIWMGAVAIAQNLGALAPR